jgi:hypothetical protein
MEIRPSEGKDSLGHITLFYYVDLIPGSCLLSAFVTIHPHPQDSVLPRFHFSDGRLTFLEGLLAETFVAISLFMESTVYFQWANRNFRWESHTQPTQ